jgi:hypothetical protein
MQDYDSQQTAKAMIQLHGLRAQAIARERAAEMRQQGDTAGMERWEAVHTAICELRQSVPAGNPDRGTASRAG